MIVTYLATLNTNERQYNLDLLSDIDQVVSFSTPWVDAEEQTVHGRHQSRGSRLTTSVEESPRFLQTRLDKL